MRLALLLATVVLGAACSEVALVESPTSTIPEVGVETGVPTAPPGTGTPPFAAPPATEPAVDEGPPVVLRGDGLGAVRFSAPVDEVIAGLTLRWGPPTSDSGWVGAAGSPFGVCPGGEVRVVGWSGFSVYFSDGPTPHGPAGTRHFFTWEYRAGDFAAPRTDPGGNRPPLATAAGISIGATVADLRAAYGDRLELFEAEEEEGGGPFFGVTTSDGTIFGGVTSLGDGGVVRRMVGGGGCGG